jgi:hypothetical protein
MHAAGVSDQHIQQHRGSKAAVLLVADRLAADAGDAAVDV